jgi:O-antigen ligase
VLGLLSYPLPLAWLGAGGLLGLAAARWHLTGRPFARTPFTLPLGLYLAGGAVGLYIAPAPETAGIRFFGLLAAVGAFFLLADLAMSAQAARRAATGALVAALVAAPALFALVIPSLKPERLPGPVRGWVTAPRAVADPVRQVAGDTFLSAQRLGLSHAVLGVLAACGIGLALGPLLAGESRKARLLGGLAVGYLGLFVALSTNFSAQLSAALVVVLLAATCRRWLLAGASGALALAVGLACGLVRPGPGWPAGQALGLPPAGNGPGTLLYRLEAWRDVLLLLRDFRFTGVGLGFDSAWQVLGSYFRSPAEGYAPARHAHSIFLECYLEQGLPGLVGLAGLVVVGLVVGRRAVAQAREPAARSAALSAAGAALALVLAGITDVVAVTTVGMVLLFGALGLLAALGRQQASRPGAPFPRPWTAAIRAPANVVRTGAFPVVAALTLAAAAACSSPGAQHLADQKVRAAFAEVYVNLGMVTLMKATMGRAAPIEERRPALEASASLLDQARRLDPGNPGIYRGLAAVALARSRPAEARRALERAEASAAADDDWFFFQAGCLYRAAGDVDRAIAAWSRANPAMGAWSGVGPGAQLARWGAGLVKAKRWQAAIKVNRAAIRAAPMDRKPYRALAVAVGRQYGPAEALATMRQLAELDPTVPWPRQEAAHLRPRLAAEEGRRKATGAPG